MPHAAFDRSRLRLQPLAQRRHDQSSDDEVTEREWFDWSVYTYPPEVKQHISFALQCRGDYGR